MVTRETSYIGQLYFGLSTDDPTEVEWHNGDRILVMDQDQMLVYDEVANDFKPISMGGGGGGGETRPTSNYHVLLQNGKETNMNQIHVAQYNSSIDGIVGYPTSRNAGASSTIYILNDNGSISLRTNLRIYTATYDGEPLELHYNYSASYYYTRIVMPADYDDTIPIILT